MKWPEKLKALPIFPHLDLVTETLSSSNTLLEAAPGVGKTTLVPLALLDAPYVFKKIITEILSMSGGRQYSVVVRSMHRLLNMMSLNF